MNSASFPEHGSVSPPPQPNPQAPSPSGMVPSSRTPSPQQQQQQQPVHSRSSPSDPLGVNALGDVEAELDDFDLLLGAETRTGPHGGNVPPHAGGHSGVSVPGSGRVPLSLAPGRSANDLATSPIAAHPHAPPPAVAHVPLEMRGHLLRALADTIRKELRVQSGMGDDMLLVCDVVRQLYEHQQPSTTANPAAVSGSAVRRGGGAAAANDRSGSRSRVSPSGGTAGAPLAAMAASMSHRRHCDIPMTRPSTIDEEVGYARFVPRAARDDYCDNLRRQNPNPCPLPNQPSSTSGGVSGYASSVRQGSASVGPSVRGTSSGVVSSSSPKPYTPIPDKPTTCKLSRRGPRSVSGKSVGPSNRSAFSECSNGETHSVPSNRTTRQLNTSTSAANTTNTSLSSMYHHSNNTFASVAGRNGIVDSREM